MNPPEQSTLFPGGSHNHVNPIVLPENKKAQKIPAICGQKCVESLMKFKRVGSLGKMFLALLIGQKEWSSSRCKLTWKLRALKHSHRLYCQLAASTPRIDERESGLLPTVTVMDASEITNLRASTVKNFEKGWKKDMSLTHFMAMGMLPTPAASLATGGQLTSRDRVSDTGMTVDGKKRQISLNDAVHRILLPTPVANDTGGYNQTDSPGAAKRYGLQGMATRKLLPTPTAVSNPKGGSHRPDPKRQNDTLASSMHGAMNLEPGTTSRLNPPFVEEMMGFPIGWTDLNL